MGRHLPRPDADSRPSAPQCDETKPTCNQCAKSRRTCPGYKDEFDLVFRNETKATERRARKANRKALEKLGHDPNSPSGLDTIFSPPLTDGSGSLSPVELVIPGLSVSIEQQASCHFVSNFVLLPQQGTTRGFMEFLIPLLKADRGNEHLHHAFNACAMASLGNRANVRGGDMASKALGEYTQALSSTHKALQNPELAKADSTLASILMLGLFEVCSPSRWYPSLSMGMSWLLTRGRRISRPSRWVCSHGDRT